MDTFTVLLILSVIGIGTVFWLLKNDSNENQNSADLRIAIGKWSSDGQGS